MGEIIKVKIADYQIASNPYVLVSYGFGSCVGVSLFDKDSKIGGLAHIMLPKGGENTEQKFHSRYADSAIKMMLADMEESGCRLDKITAKLAGGASMFPNLKKSDKGIGDRNVEAVMEVLEYLEIPIAGSDTGGDYGRSISFYTDTGKMRISSIRQGVTII